MSMQGAAMLKISLLLSLFLDRVGICSFGPCPACSDLAELELRYRQGPNILELCLLHKGLVLGHACAHLHPTPVWLDPPCGVPWAKLFLEEILETMVPSDQQPDLDCPFFQAP